ncbi:MAG: DNA-binding NarL/FixJ family response regulator [Patiriisocius sp.]|jgi:DNA-binding NarL/FixJ family response regulator
MIKKVLVAEDIDSINIGVVKTLKEQGILDYDVAQYCDDAYVKFKKELLDEAPYDLLITDLSFKKDHRNEKLANGEALLTQLKKEQPSLKIIVFTVEDHPQKFKTIWETGFIDAYVCKDRNGLKNLIAAIETIKNGGKYTSLKLQRSIGKKNTVQITELDTMLITLLSEGYTQKEIEILFKAKNISPSSRSSIEKRLKDLRDDLGAKTMIHLVTIAKELRLI